MKTMLNKQKKIFNCPLEAGLRALIILDAESPTLFDLQRMSYYDYLLVHSGDVLNAPSSLHPALPYRSGEWLVRREIIERGIGLMVSRELLLKRFTDNGIFYLASPLTSPFLTHFTSEYYQALKLRADWLKVAFSETKTETISELMHAQSTVWGAEFKNDSIFRGSRFEY